MLASYAYDRAPTGEPTRVVREDGSQVVLVYDAAMRLTLEEYRSASGVVVERVGYGYDAGGNRTARQRHGLVEVYGYGPGSRLDTITSTSGVEYYVHDADGRLSTISRDGTTRTLTYSSEGVLTSVSGGGAGAVSYGVNGAGAWVTATSSVGTRRFVSAPLAREGLARLYAVTNGAGTVHRRYVYAGDRPLVRLDAGVASYYLEDGLGSMVGLSGASGTLSGRVEYDGFGNVRSSSGAMMSGGTSGGEFGFHGAWLETSTGLYHVHAREYDPRTGRFLSRDPAEAELLMPETGHPYAYAASNPLLYWDVNGRNFDLVSINLSMSVQDITDAVQKAAINALKEHVKDKVIGTVTNVVTSIINSMIPGAGTALDAVRDFGGLNPVDQGNVFDQLVKESVCSVFQGGWDDNVWLAPSINPHNGEPMGNGLNCGETGSGSLGPGSRPDFLISKHRPTSLGTGGRKSYLIGEVKLSLYGLQQEFEGNGSNQLNAMVHHAQYFQYTPTALFITLRARDRDIHEPAIRAWLLSRGVFGVLLTVLP